MDKSVEDVPVEDLTPEEASRIIHSHRKVRYGTACWPCRQRKVKCDNKQPCENCVKRDHPKLCSYKPNPRSNAAKSTASVEGSSSRKRGHSPDEARDHKADKRQGSWPRSIVSVSVGVDEYEVSDEARYLGQNSIPELLREQQQSPKDEDNKTDIRYEMRPILGLDTSAPFPLMSAAHIDRLAQDILAELPSDREVMKLFRTYREICQPFWGFVIDVEDLENKLMVYLEERARNAKSATRTSKPVSASWLAILFAVLAVGSQYHDSPYHVRTRDSQKYLQTSFHFLRIGNFLLRPTFDAIQALLLTSFVLLNDMKAEASWGLLGLTCRLAQSLGIHRQGISAEAAAAPLEPNSREMIRRKLWWTCVWHDSLTSLSFDRPPMTNMPCCPIPVLAGQPNANWNYLEGLYHLIQIIRDRLNPDVAARATYQTILTDCQTIEDLRAAMAPNIRDKGKCRTALDRLQHYAIRLHTSFIISVFCRPALRRDCLMNPEQKASLAARCKDSLAETVRMFLAMHQLSVIPTRSWAFTYNGLSSALLLGILCETKADPEVRQLQGDLIAALSATAAKEQTSPPPGPVRKTDRDIELSGPLWRALTALKNIYDHGCITGSKRESESGPCVSGNRTPMGPLALSQAPTNGLVGMSRQANAESNSALTIAPVQNGGVSSSATATDFSGYDTNPILLTPTHLPPTPVVLPPSPCSLSLLPSSCATLPRSRSLVNPHSNVVRGSANRKMPPLSLSTTLAGVQSSVALDNLPGLDPNASNMSPMDLYESIWWESPEPWNTTVDQMPFDFMPQPPPGQTQQSQFYF
ncbi:hypothetical protein TD95_000779 [Thielaviopsis punctulata]|uniref:Zn(2)-C6 fungal-type domain-containing protein n=1 Tax=Thielaviopsis punctulata TaxID=72032 RepID=A0A0F4ZAF4_9PEZI|nr:hypothetical protein TD95_000779 [Thielaviopsis punctulata]